MFLIRSISATSIVLLLLPFILSAGENNPLAESGIVSEPGVKCIVKVDTLSVKQMLQTDLNAGEAFIWYLLHSGFAIKTKSRLLILDYIEVYRNKQDTATQQRLSTGWIDPEELKDQKVYVFVSHAHRDHYDTTILNWRKELKNVTYIFGWKAGDDVSHHYFTNPRETKIIDGMEIFTINSHHGGIPEVGYLVKIDGLTIYHSGDCRDNNIEEIAYLQSISKSVDIAFQYDIDLDEPLNDFVIHPLIALQPRVAFPMHLGDEEYLYQESCKRWQANGYKGECQSSSKRGDSFLYRR